jgi:hypothetical protein
MFRWNNIGSTTKDGVLIITTQDRWNGAILQKTIKGGSYSESIIKSSWFESLRKPIKKEVEYKDITLQDEPNSSFGNDYKFVNKKSHEESKTKIVQVPPNPIYLLSSKGLIKVWISITSLSIIWLIFTVIKKARG